MTAESVDSAQATARALSRFEIGERWGDPDEQSGSVNDPRTGEEHGIRFNEKWIYLLPGGDRRLVYWLRYDFSGCVRVSPDGTVRPETP